METQTNPVYKIDVLLFDDTEMNRELICARLAKLGITPDIAQDGREGVEMVSRRIQDGNGPYDIIFMDIMMPVMDGIEATGEILRLCGGVPVIAMTPDCTAEEREKYLSHGMADCLGKPFTMQELRECLARNLDESVRI